MTRRREATPVVPSPSALDELLAAEQQIAARQAAIASSSWSARQWIVPIPRSAAAVIATSVASRITSATCHASGRLSSSLKDGLIPRVIHLLRGAGGVRLVEHGPGRLPGHRRGDVERHLGFLVAILVAVCRNEDLFQALDRKSVV